MDVVFLSPDYPTDLPMFVSGLAGVGATVIGVGDQHVDGLTPRTKHALASYVQVGGWSDQDAAFESILHQLRGRHVDRVETLWEPLVHLAARLRERIGVPGMSVADAVAFRDKGVMKQRVEAAGLRTPRSVRSTTRDGCRAAAAELGYPIIVKPISGAGSADTFRIDDDADLERALAALGHVPEVSVEEFISGDEFTFDTVCADGEILFENVVEYRPNPLIGKQVEWISPQVIAYRDLSDPFIADGVELGRRVIDAMGFRTGFTHMEWYRKHDGEVVFGEIAARSPGGLIPEVMNYACDTDVFSGWAEAVCHGTFSQPTERRYNVAQIFKRAQGHGVITHIEGVGELMGRFGEHVANIDLVQPGQPRRDWQQTVISDGVIVVRHTDFDTAVEMGNWVAANVHLYC